MEIHVQIPLFPLLYLCRVFNYHFIIYTNVTHIAASNTVNDDVTN